MNFIHKIIDFFTSLLCKESSKHKENNNIDKVIATEIHKKRVVSIECNLYVQPTEILQNPHLTTTLGTFFGKDIKDVAIKKCSKR